MTKWKLQNLEEERPCNSKIHYTVDSRRIEGSQINFLDFKRDDFNELREKERRDQWMKILMRKMVQESRKILKNKITKDQMQTKPKRNRRHLKKSALLYKELSSKLRSKIKKSINQERYI